MHIQLCVSPVRVVAQCLPQVPTIGPERDSGDHDEAEDVMRLTRGQ